MRAGAEEGLLGCSRAGAADADPGLPPWRRRVGAGERLPFAAAASAGGGGDAH